ncbi:MAG: DUF3800 domain-containing protein [Chitinophagales bacterium]|nr:DUF3800 domain-containing protein [Chitinophagales bacterium]
MSISVNYIYCDESRQSKDRYMVLGGIIMNKGDIPQFNETMKKFRAEENMNAELKWSKVSSQKLNEYKRFVDYFFALNNTDNIHFHSIIIDNHQVIIESSTKETRSWASINSFTSCCFIVLEKCIVTKTNLFDLQFT